MDNTYTLGTIEHKIATCQISIKDVEQTEELCSIAVSYDHTALKYVNEQTKQICERAITTNPEQIKYVKPELLSTDLCWYVIKRRPTNIQNIPIDFVTEDMCWYVMNKDVMLFLYIPQECQTQEMVDFIMTKNVDVFFHRIHPKYHTKDLVRSFIIRARLICDPLKQVAKEYFEKYPEDIPGLVRTDPDLCSAIVSILPEMCYAIKDLPFELYVKAIKYDGQILNQVNDEIFVKLVKQDRSLVKHIDSTDIRKCVFIAAIDPQLLASIKWSDKTVVNQLLKINPLFCEYIPMDFVSKEILFELCTFDSVYYDKYCTYFEDKDLIQICKANPHFLAKIQRQTFQICQVAVEADPKVVVFVSDQDMRMKLASKYPLRAPLKSC